MALLQTHIPTSIKEMLNFSASRMYPPYFSPHHTLIETALVAKSAGYTYIFAKRASDNAPHPQSNNLSSSQKALVKIHHRLVADHRPIHYRKIMYIARCGDNTYHNHDIVLGIYRHMRFETIENGTALDVSPTGFLAGTTASAPEQEPLSKV